MAGLPDQAIAGPPYRLTLGLRSLDLADWIVVDEHFDAELAAKAELLASVPGEVLAVLPSGTEPSRELLELLTGHLARYRPQLGRTVDPRQHPIEAAARLVQEDLCVLARSGGTWRLVAACVCSPSRWRLADKIGCSLAEIHDPVPGYRDRISDPTDTLFDRLTVQRPMWRSNWTLLPDPELFQPGPATVTREPVHPSDYVVRVERQTIRVLPVTAAIVFTIRTFCARLGELTVGEPQTVRALATTLPTVPEPTLAYKGLTHAAPGLIDWLANAVVPD